MPFILNRNHTLGSLMHKNVAGPETFWLHPLFLTLSAHAEGSLQSLNWTGGLDRWTGLVD